MAADKSQKQKDVIAEARSDGRKLHFVSLVDLCHLKNSELNHNFRNIKVESYSEVTEVMDIISRQPGCDGQAADAVSAYTQVRMEDAPALLKIPKSECPDVWIRPPKHKWPQMIVQCGRSGRSS